MECPKCKGMMSEGFVLDRGHYGSKLKPVWVEGKPEESLLGGLKTKDRQTYNV